MQKERLEGPDGVGAVEEHLDKITVIDGYEVLGYRGEGREEHSGENSPVPFDDLESELADNRPEEVLVGAE